MDAQSFVGQLLDLPDPTTQRRFLEEHASVLDDQIANALKAQADQFLRADIQRSFQTAYLLCQMAEVTGKPSYRALSLLADANAVSIGLGQYQRGIDLYDQAAEIYRTDGRQVDYAKSQVGKIGSLFNLGRYEQALEIGRWASRILEEHAERKPLATVIMNMGTTYRRMGEFAEALEMYDQAGELYRQLGAEGRPGLGLVEMNRAVVLRQLGRFDASIQASLTAQALLIQLQQKVEAVRARQSLALTYFVLGRYNEALDHLDQVRDVFVEDGRQRDAMLVELFISDCLLQLRRFTDVLEKCRRVRSLFGELGARYVMAQALVNEAVAYMELGRYEDALNSLAEARGVFEEENNRVWMASTDLEQAAVLMRQGEFENSLSLALACADVFQAYDSVVEEAQARLLAARAALGMGRHGDAQQMIQAALTIGETRHLPTVAYQAHRLLGALAAARGNFQVALAEFDRTIEALERLRGKLMVEFRVGFLEDKEEVYQDAVGLCVDLDLPGRALEYAERAKSRALIDLLAQRINLNLQARDDADRALVDELVRLRMKRDQLYRSWESDEKFTERGWISSSSDRQRAQREVLELENQITERWHKLLIHNADYARDAALWQVRTEPIQPYLAPDTLLLEYFVVHRQLIAFLVTDTAVRTVRLPVEIAAVQQLMQRLWLNFGTVPRSVPAQIAQLESNARDLLKDLYERLIGPIAHQISGYARLTIVPHGPLHYLPFHALHDGKSYLVERHEISYLPAGSFLRYCREAPRSGAGLIALGHSIAGRLPHVVEEARAIATLMHGRAYVEDDATLSRIQDMAAQCHILHLAAHGDFRPDNPLFSGLALADGWLTTLDIFNLRLSASLVTLSACQTGRSVVGGGDELLGLMRAFLSAGAASLALSLWAVEDRSTAQLMETFYRQLAEGHTKAAALRSAQLQFILGQHDEAATAALYTHPYFWAPFFLVGDAGAL
jgi:CHAT domain-containing protein